MDENKLPEEEKVDGRSKRAHDEHGHFIKDRTEAVQEKNSNDYESSPRTPIEIPGVKVHKTSDDGTLVDVHVNNPLQKMIKLLEDIKKQKAFTFDIKGSLGLAGIFLVITAFGIFGGTKAFCSKGVQSHIGQVMVLTSVEEHTEMALVQRAVNAWNALVSNPPVESNAPTRRVVLIQKDDTVYKIVGATTKMISSVINTPVILTGEVDACSQTITLKSSEDVQEYPID